MLFLLSTESFAYIALVDQYLLQPYSLDKSVVISKILRRIHFTAFTIERFKAIQYMSAYLWSYVQVFHLNGMQSNCSCSHSTTTRQISTRAALRLFCQGRFIYRHSRCPGTFPGAESSLMY